MVAMREDAQTLNISQATRYNHRSSAASFKSHHSATGSRKNLGYGKTSHSLLSYRAPNARPEGTTDMPEG